MFKLTCTECQCQDFTVAYDHNRNLKVICLNCGEESDVRLELAQLVQKQPEAYPTFMPGRITCNSGGN